VEDPVVGRAEGVVPLSPGNGDRREGKDRADCGSDRDEMPSGEALGHALTISRSRL
jgi:hypothetical protein